MAKATRSPQAQRDLRDLARYIAVESQSVDAAVRVIDRIDQRVLLCLSQPELGQLCPELGEDVRRTVVEAYSIFYRKSSTRHSGTSHRSCQSRFVARLE